MASCSRITQEVFPLPFATKSMAVCVGCPNTCVQISVSRDLIIQNALIIPHRNFRQEGGSYTTRDSISAPFFPVLKYERRDPVQRDFLSTFFLGGQKESGRNALLGENTHILPSAIQKKCSHLLICTTIATHGGSL